MQGQPISADDFLSPAVALDPYPLYRRLQAEQPVTWVEPLQGWHAVSYADVVAALRNPDLGSHVDRAYYEALAPGAPDHGSLVRRHFERWLLFTDPPDHTRLRGLVQPFYGPASVRRLRTAVERRSEQALEAAERSGRLEALGEWAVPMGRAALAALLGLPDDELAEATAWSAQLLEFMNTPPSEATIVRAGELIAGITALMRASWTRTDLPADSLLAALRTALDAGRLDEVEAAALVTQNLTGALGALPQLVVHGLLALVADPGRLAALRAAPRLVPGAVEEMLRYEPPFLMIVRRAVAGTGVGAARVEAGQVVRLFIGAANRDPARFPDADRLVVTRQPNPHVSFGSDRHFCLGASMSRSVAQIAFRSLLARPARFELAGAVDRGASFGMRWLDSLHLAVHP